MKEEGQRGLDDRNLFKKIFYKFKYSYKLWHSSSGLFLFSLVSFDRNIYFFYYYLACSTSRWKPKNMLQIWVLCSFFKFGIFLAVKHQNIDNKINKNVTDNKCMYTVSCSLWWSLVWVTHTHTHLCSEVQKRSSFAWLKCVPLNHAVVS